MSRPPDHSAVEEVAPAGTTRRSRRSRLPDHSAVEEVAQRPSRDPGIWSRSYPRSPGLETTVAGALVPRASARLLDHYDPGSDLVPRSAPLGLRDLFSLSQTPKVIWPDLDRTEKPAGKKSCDRTEF